MPSLLPAPTHTNLAVHARAMCMFRPQTVHQLYRQVFKIHTVCIHHFQSCHSSFQVTIKLPAFFASINQITVLYRLPLYCPVQATIILSCTGYHYTVPYRLPLYCPVQATIILSRTGYRYTVLYRLPLSPLC
jgi:hypothetical protein